MTALAVNEKLWEQKIEEIRRYSSGQENKLMNEQKEILIGIYQKYK